MRLGTKYAATFLLACAVGYGDFIVGAELSFSIFYLLPIGFAAWFLNGSAGMVVALISAVFWYVVEVQQHPPFSNSLIPIWNGMVRLTFFSITVALVRSIHGTERRLMRGIAARTKSLQTESARRRQLERELIEVTTREQTRLAQDLHDGLGQYLSALAFHARILSEDLHQQQSSHAAQADRIVELVRITNQMIRQLDRAMRVPDENGGGLVGAIRTLAAEVQELTGVPVELQRANEAPTLDSFHSLMLFRIVQESLNNALKHGRPTAVRIDLTRENGALRVRVADDGRGTSATPDHPFGAGVRIMQLRARLIGATLTVDRAPIGGWVVECVVPLGVEAVPGTVAWS